MDVLESCPKHNMVAYLEKTDGNAEFHEVIDFLARSSIYNALTVSPVVSTTFVEQFWMSAKSKIINNVRYITAKVAGKPVSISEESIRSDLLFYDVDRIDSLPNKAIFDAIQLMGHLDTKKKFVMYPRFISIFLDKQLMNVPVPLDHFPVNALTSKVFSFMVKKGKHFLGKVTPLFASMLVQPTEDEGSTSERPSEPQPTPSPPHLSEANVEPQSDPSSRPSPSTHIPHSIPESSGGNHRDQAKEIKHLKAQIKKLKKKAKPGRRPAKAEPSVHKDPLFDELADDTLDFMDTENAQDMGRSKVSTDRSRVSTEKEEVSTDRPDEGTDDQTKGRSATPTTQTPTPTIFRDDETIDQVLLNMSQAKEVSREKEKGIDPKDKGKKKIKEEDESDTESEGIPEAEKKFKQLFRDEEMTRKVQEDWEAKEEVKKLAKEEAIKTALSNEYDFIQARIEADRLLALRLQDEERESSSLWKREQSSFMIQLQLKEGFLQNKELLQSEINLLQELMKRFDESFTAVGSTEDERRIKEMNEGVKDTDHKKLKEEDHQQTYLLREDEHRKCLKIVTFEGTIDSEIMKKKSFIARLNKVLHIFDRQDLYHLYNLMMEQYSEITLEGSELILWGDLKKMNGTSTEEMIKVIYGMIKQD
ncbi:hypothetical protein Tco_0730420 [Tanacetum coccineum]|uniref:Uncharacterized protein n=1 Tax=Tanacetum coccineum TaxID=301880 RepID=A0ABQ4YRQ7_9ASTR